jgi:hypothetical protein
MIGDMPHTDNNRLFKKNHDVVDDDVLLWDDDKKAIRSAELILILWDLL